MATNIPQLDYQKTALRLPKDLHAQLHLSAAESGRSYNAEIVSRLQTSFDQSADTGRLQADLDRADAIIDMHSKFIRAMSLTESFLANYLVRVVESLPQKMRESGAYDLALEFAKSRLDEDVEKSAKVLRKLFAEDTEAIAAMDDEMIKLSPAIEAKKRGESTLPFLEADILKSAERIGAENRTRKLTPKK